MPPKHDARVTEAHIQALLMRHIFESLRHELVIPNVNALLPYEADLVSFTRHGLLHEWEIKLDRYDYADDLKKPKHKTIPLGLIDSPAYFWYATYNFSISPPPHAGWVLVTSDGKVTIKKEAPNHNSWKMGADKYRYAAITLSKRVMRMYLAYYFKQNP